MFQRRHHFPIGSYSELCRHFKQFPLAALLTFSVINAGSLSAQASPSTQPGTKTSAAPAAAASGSGSAASTNSSGTDDRPRKRKWAQSSIKFPVAAPQDVVWSVLIDFDRYPEIFKRIESCKVTKRDGDIVFTESYLKPQLFVRERLNHTSVNLSRKPDAFNWKLLDGNFKGAEGRWDMKPIDKTKTEVTYTVAVDPGPVIPATLVSWVLHMVVKEVVDGVQNTCATAYSAKSNAKQ